MSEKSRRRFFRRTMLGIWAAITLILLFCVALLLNEMSRQGVALPDVSAALPQASAPATAAQRPAQSIRDVSLFFANANGTHLSKESVELSLTNSTVSNCRTLMERLIEGPRSLDNIATIPSAAGIRGVYLIEDGELVLDLSREVAQDLPEGALAEGLFVYSVVGTLTQPAAAGEDGAVRSVRFLFEGSPQDRFPKHIDASAPIAPDPSWYREADAANG